MAQMLTEAQIHIKNPWILMPPYGALATISASQVKTSEVSQRKVGLHLVASLASTPTSTDWATVWIATEVMNAPMPKEKRRSSNAAIRIATAELPSWTPMVIRRFFMPLVLRMLAGLVKALRRWPARCPAHMLLHCCAIWIIQLPGQSNVSLYKR